MKIDGVVDVVLKEFCFTFHTIILHFIIFTITFITEHIIFVFSDGNLFFSS